MAAVRVEGAPAIAPDGAATVPSALAGSRIAYLDRLKLSLVALIIAGHAILAYGDLENAWPYQSVQEVHLGAVSNVVVDLVAIPIAMFAIGLFFLLSGLVAPDSLRRHGAAAFARARLLRLGVPLAIWTLLLWPTAVCLAHVAAGESHWPWWNLAHDEPLLDTGPMWFVLVLLIFSLAYAAWRVRDGSDRPRVAPVRSISAATLTRLAVGISLLNLLVRPVFPAAGNEFLQIHLWQWPQCVALFCLGIVASRGGWLEEVPDALLRRAGRLALVGAVGFVLVVLALAASGTDGELIFETGFHWPALALAVAEGPLAVGASVLLLGFAQRRLSRAPGPVGQALARSAYGAFMLQGLVLIALMIALRPLGAPAEVKAILVAAGGVVGSFALSWLLVSRTPVGRIV